MFITSVKNNIDRFVAIILVILMALMVINVSWQVASRYIFQNPSAFTDELARYMLIWVGMLGAAYVAGKDEHLAIDLIQAKLSFKNQLKVKIIIHVCVMIFAIVAMVIGGTNLVYITFILDQTSAALEIPLAYVYIIIPISGLLVIFYQAESIMKLSSNLKTD
ncbi:MULTISPECIES: TRAP transporter small permease [unclassified Algoriphagus]|jgi:TRAP-type C4-dicarboxylate transport system permease small subunit|uniref:TRAP transporter small permease n=2 Tax=Algoriphagus TaxID=246875 RepID=UPI000C48FAFA|nr:MULTISPECIES: TRAP transporter small permease [unclassified Algoriphagus]MAL14215.1 TRAP transporter permease DctQ [Algoriphagus sp.]MAN88116.1 TRAP transporter permease DctQ [Algoriphagus sp.]HAD50444.1 TRAP transporter small permease [Algoriphagus sp.]HAH38711.1 TRAP transporter small permease [Algoriphagus sp.]HAS56975.1 TRAP transporter small permease [Algoriphagus sp.]|tara:strand:+ start:115 stop:603 length:489 start_codon:yes stop_codon:yes gene_type:complete